MGVFVVQASPTLAASISQFFKECFFMAAKITTKGNKVTIEVDLDMIGKPSTTGKTLILGSTDGNKKIEMEDGTTIFVGVNIFKKKE